ncbi:hypothetical protein B0T09DRAFT_329721 [Sordaria sp. MPI-SDFR-AT-0083]|nr:hypothetical protein B0T09DRAFT_329721 [Sordaria sp. MPI-SDFR-AT-0083]
MPGSPRSPMKKRMENGLVELRTGAKNDSQQVQGHDSQPVHSPPQGHDSIDGDVLHPGTRSTQATVSTWRVPSSAVDRRSFLLPLQFSSTPSTAPLKAGSEMLFLTTTPRSLLPVLLVKRGKSSVSGCQHGTDR